MAFLISVLDVVLSSIFATLVLREWWRKRKPYQLLWGGALLIWAVAVFAEMVAAYQGMWSPFTYRVYYAFGALMVAAWLGAGSLFLVLPRRGAMAALAFVLLLSLAGGVLVFTWPIDPSGLTRTDVLGFVETKMFPFIPVRVLIVMANIFGTVAFVGSALYSVWLFSRRQMERERMVGVALIALGGIVAASAHSIGVLGGLALFRVSELMAISLIFAGYLVGSLPLRRKVSRKVAVA
ncbi:MAG: hypothetical protein Q9O62_08110 [Ardenticatenia bacterium]|nr:hypothetical protein [Ardenticatenia bacterium]